MSDTEQKENPSQQHKNWRGLADNDIIEILRDYNMEPSPNRMNYTKEIIRTLMERNTCQKN